jgi:hypothetical protein
MQFVRGAEKADEFCGTAGLRGARRNDPAMRGDKETDEFCETTNCVARGAMNPAMVAFCRRRLALDTH